MGEFSTEEASVWYVFLDPLPADDPSESSADACEEPDDTDDDALRRPLSDEMSGAL